MGPKPYTDTSTSRLTSTANCLPSGAFLFLCWHHWLVRHWNFCIRQTRTAFCMLHEAWRGGEKCTIRCAVNISSVIIRARRGRKRNESSKVTRDADVFAVCYFFHIVCTIQGFLPFRLHSINCSTNSQRRPTEMQTNIANGFRHRSPNWFLNSSYSTLMMMIIRSYKCIISYAHHCAYQRYSFLHIFFVNGERSPVALICSLFTGISIDRRRRENQLKKWAPTIAEYVLRLRIP